MVRHSPEWQRVSTFLAKNSFLGRLPDGVLDALMRNGKIRRHTNGDIIFRRGEPGDSLLVLTSGQAMLTSISPTAREIVMHFVGAGDVFGETSALDGKDRAVTAVALEDLEAFIIRSRDLLPAKNLMCDKNVAPTNDDACSACPLVRRRVGIGRDRSSLRAKPAPPLRQTVRGDLPRADNTPSGTGMLRKNSISRLPRAGRRSGMAWLW